MSFKYNFINEWSADGGFRFLKNITGFWIIQKCKKFWDEKVKLYSYDELIGIALKYDPTNFKIDLDDSKFLKPVLLVTFICNLFIPWLSLLPFSSPFMYCLFQRLISPG
jgi:rhamnulokinase